ncbi:MAG: aminotransferase class III-fold pyridoxal phosphate-dependent enzyme, partial [Pseudomonadota bacterium]
VFFATGGSTAVDSALRFAHFRNNLLGRPEKKMIIAREKGYHGSTYLSATVSGKGRDKSFMETEGRLAHILPDVNPYLRPDGMSVEEWCDAKVADLEAAILGLGPDKVAAFIAEPILASGGVIVPAPGYHRRTWELCRQHDILYISDEVVTGFGRLGHWFASKEVFGVTPDIITCAKGLTSGYMPLGAMIVSDRVLDEMKAEDRSSVMFSNGYTYSGHPVACAAALANIELFEREDLLAHVRAVTPRFQQRLAGMARFDIVGDTRGMGLIGCVEGAAAKELPEEKRLAIDAEFGNRVDAKCEAMGLIVRPIINMCVVSPALVITEAEIDEMFDIMETAVAEVEREML